MTTQTATDDGPDSLGEVIEKARSELGEDKVEVDQVIAALEAKLQDKPDDAEGWRMLGWSYFETGRFAESATAMRRAIQLAPGNSEYHSMLGEALVMNWRVADLTARQRAMLEFAEKLTLASARTEEADRQALRDAGFSDRDIWDIASVTGFYNMTNRIASATGMQPNPDYHGAAR